MGEWVVSLFSQGVSLYNSFGSVRYSSRAQAERCVGRLAKQAKGMDAIEVFRDTRVSSSQQLLFQWRWKLKIYNVIDERRADEGIRAQAEAGDQQSKFIPIFLDCPDFTTDERFDSSEDASRDALRFIEITATISAITFTTYSQCQSKPNMLTWATVPRYNNGGMDSRTLQLDTVFICHAMNALIQTSFKSMNMDAPYSQPAVSNTGLNKEL